MFLSSLQLFVIFKFGDFMHNVILNLTFFIIVVVLRKMFVQKVACYNLRDIKLKYLLLVSKAKLTFPADFLLSK